MSLVLVSVIVRTTGRPSLNRAIESISRQTYGCIEVVVVNAACQELHLPETVGNGFPVRPCGSDLPMKRSAAANFGLLHAQGEYCLFLDDDDWIHPEHVERLMRTLLAYPESVLAYAGVECLQGDPLRCMHVFDAVFSRARLLAENYIPIHAALFRRRVWDLGCRFDENFDLHEDWDFWLQLVQLGDFAHCPGVSASYQLGETGSGVWIDQQGVYASMNRVFEKWWHCWVPRDALGYIQALREDIKSCRLQVDDLDLKAANCEQRLIASRQQFDALDNKAAECEQNLIASRRQFDALDIKAAECEQNLIERRRQLDAFHLQAAENEKKLQAALRESQQYADSLRGHLDGKEQELKVAHEEIVRLFSINALPNNALPNKSE